MALTPSNMLPLQTAAPDFDLPDTQGRRVTLASLRDKPLLVVAFICNHCPFVKHIRQKLAEVAREYQEKGVAFVGINANDTEAFPADNMENMKKEVREVGYSFPYLLDETQETAKAYDAACTPDFYLFDRDRRLIYRGQFDASRPGNDIPVTGADLIGAMECALAGQAVPTKQTPSIGCNIKWKRGNAPE